MKSTFNYINGGEVGSLTELKAVISEMTNRGLFFTIENGYYSESRKRSFFMVKILPGQY